MVHCYVYTVHTKVFCAGVQKKRAKQQAANSLPATDDDNSAADENWSVASVISDNSSCDWGGAESSNHCEQC